jgi:hypothetical protein
MGLKRFGGGPRRIITPEQLEERAARNDRTAMQPEHREDRARFGTGDGDRQAVLPDL